MQIRIWRNLGNGDVLIGTECLNIRFQRLEGMNYLHFIVLVILLSLLCYMLREGEGELSLFVSRSGYNAKYGVDFRQVTPKKIGGTETCFNTSFPLSTLLCTGYSVKMINKETTLIHKV